MSKCVIVTWKVPAAALPINCTEIWSESILSRMPPRHGLILHSTYPCTGYSMCVCIPSQFCTITISRQEKTAWPNNNWNCTDLWSRNWAECLQKIKERFVVLARLSTDHSSETHDKNITDPCVGLSRSIVSLFRDKSYTSLETDVFPKLLLTPTSRIRERSNMIW
jgi:hypothetical protein